MHQANDTGHLGPLVSGIIAITSISIQPSKNLDNTSDVFILALTKDAN